MQAFVARPDNQTVRQLRATARRGQAAIEAALVMPLMVFFCLGIVQLTLVQQARLMTEYAAYQAVRAGVVWNGNNERMHDAAIVALLPTMGRTDDILQLGKTWGLASLYDTALGKLQWNNGVVPASFNGANLLGLVRVDTVNPAYFTPIETLWRLPDGVNWKELDFDGPDAFPETPFTKFAEFFNLDVRTKDQEIYRKSTVLSIRLRYWYEMKVPFANQVIFLSWFAANADVALYGGIERSSTTKENMLGKSGDASSLQGGGRGIRHQKGFDSLYQPEMRVLWGLASGDIPILSKLIGKRYFLPLTATHSMRMQSNFHRKWIMHLNPSWGL